jgi:hypothetical protein
MSALERLEARVETAELAARYAQRCDARDWKGVVELFTPDGIIDAEAVYGCTCHGPDELLAFFEQAPEAVAHHPTSVSTTVRNDGSVTAHMKMLVVFRRWLFSVAYDWRVVRTESGWRIAHQTIGVVGKVAVGENGGRS